MARTNILAVFRQNRTVVSNITWLSAASLVAKPLWFIFITAVCLRFLGIEGYGELTTAMSLGALAFSLAGCGLETLTVQRVAPAHRRAAAYFNNFLVVRVGLAAGAIALALAAATVLGYSASLFSAVLASCVYFFALSLVDLVRAFFQAFEQLGRQAVTVVVEKLLVISTGAIALLLLARADVVLFAMAIGALGTLALALFLLAKDVRLWPLPTISGRFLKTSLRMAMPFGIAAILGMFYFRIDTVMVEAILGVADAGRYGIAFRIVEALNMLPLIVVQAALYPRFAILVNGRRWDELRNLTFIAAALLILVSLPFAAALTIWSDSAISLMAGDQPMGAAGPALAVLCWAFPLTCLRLLLYYKLIAMHRQVHVAMILGGALALNVGLNAILIPTLGIQGAAVATILSETLLLLTYFLTVRRVVHKTRAQEREEILGLTS